MNKIILCADDYGQNADISRGIIELITQKRLSATSCITNTPYWMAAAKLLQPFVNKVDIGLHFNLTEGTALGSLNHNGSLPTLSNLLVRAFIRNLKVKEIIAELNKQIDQFEDGLNRLPDYIDGHQHIHQFPVIRNAIIQVYQTRFKNKPCYIRCVSEPSGLFFKPQSIAKCKRALIYLSGGHQFKKMLQRANIPHNSSFSGIYDFSGSKHYAELFPCFLANVGPGGLIMCHPGFKSTDTSDSIAKSRYDEYQYFSSDAFTLHCNNQQVQLARFCDL